MTENFPDEEELLKAFPPPVDGPDSACAHLKVTVYSRMVSAETWYEPAEYAFKIVCNECGEQFDETPDGAEETEADWEDDDWEDDL